MNEENSLLTGAVRPALLRYALPIILSMVATQFYAVADTMIIGLRLDADALAAVSNASTVLMIFLFISGGMELGGGLLVAAGKPTATKHEMTELLYNLLFVDEVIALLTTAVGFVTLPALLRLINTPAEILDTAVLYGRIYLMGLPFLMPYDLSKECVMGCGDSKTPLKVIVATSVMNIVLDLVLVGPFGVAGAAAATAAAQVQVRSTWWHFCAAPRWMRLSRSGCSRRAMPRIFSGCRPQQYSAGQRHHHHHGQAGAAGRSGCGSHCGFLLRRQAVQPVDDAGVRLCAVHSVLYCAKHSRPPAGPCKRGPAGRAADLVGVFAWGGGGLHRSAGAAAPTLYHRPGSSQLWLHHAGL